MRLHNLILIGLVMLTALIPTSTVMGWGVVGLSGSGAGGVVCTVDNDSEIYSHTGHSSGSTSFSDVRWKGLPFSVASTTTVTQVDVWVINGSGGALNATVEIYTVSGGEPTSIVSVGATKTESVSPTAGAVVSFVFENPFSIGVGDYAAIVKGTADNQLGAGLDAEAGHFYYTSDSGSNWGDDTNANGYLVVYGCQ